MSTLIDTIEKDLESAWGVIAPTVEQDALTIWADFRAIITALLPAEYSTLKTLILAAIVDVADGDIADIETSVLNAAVSTAAWVLQIGSATLQAIIAVVKAGL